MAYILITHRKKGNPIVTWNFSIRENGMAYPTRKATYLGLLDSSGKKLIKSKDLPELSDEIMEGLKKKNIEISSEKAAPRGRKPVFLRRTTLASLPETRIEVVGTYRVLQGLAESCGFYQTIQKTFQEDGEAIFALMCQRLDSRIQGYLFKDWSEDSPFDSVRLSMSPKVISSLLCRIERLRLVFSKNWYEACGKPKVLLENSTHFYTLARNDNGRSYDEYGWDHHQEAGKRQINVMSLVDKATSLPIMYHAYPGSINDISTFMETNREMKFVDESASILFVSDSAYFSNFNMWLMLKDGHNFVMETKWNSQTLAILSEKREKLNGPGEYVKHVTYTYRAEPCTYVLHDNENPLAQKSIYGYIFYSILEARQLQEELISELLLCKEKFTKYVFSDMGQAQEWIDSSAGSLGKYLRIEQGEKGFKAEIDNEKFANACERFGFHILLTTVKDMSASELMETYHSRDPMQKLRTTMKSTLKGKSLMTKIDATTQGQIFIVWGAAILYQLLKQGLKHAELSMSINESLFAMSKLKLLCFKEDVIPMTPPKKGKDVIVGLGLEKKFPEFMDYLEADIKEREYRLLTNDENKSGRGRPCRHKLKNVQK